MPIVPIAEKARDSMAVHGSAGAPGEEISYVDDGLYDSLHAFLRRARTRSEGPNLDDQELRNVEKFIYFEAALLDDRRYRDWLELFSDAFVYWLPSTRDPQDPRHEVAINFDDRRRLLDRITLMETGVQVAQLPASRTARAVTNVMAWRDDDGFVGVRSNILISEYRLGRITTYAGRQDHRLEFRDGRFRTQFKIISLINSEEPQGNTTFIL
ncbi:MAG TPA: aromatic-ring-hydroxylating dioxygenase subunit beta [Hyphomicrobiaceae bacterium]